MQADVADARSVEEMSRVCLESLGSVSILVNNPGVSTGNAPMESVTEGDWDRVMDTNAEGTFLCSKALTRTWPRAGRLDREHKLRRRVEALRGRYGLCLLQGRGDNADQDNRDGTRQGQHKDELHMPRQHPF